MKKTILSIIYVLLLLAIIGLYIFDVVVNQTPFTKNLFRTISIAFLCLVGFGRLNYSVGRKNLQVYESHYADVIRSAFQGQFMNRNKLLCAARLFDEGNYRKALKYLGQLQKECKTQDEFYAVWLFIALCFTDSQMHPEAIQIYRQMVNNQLADSRVFSNMGYVYAAMGEPEKAMSSYKEALYLDKNNASTHVNIANVHFGRHELEEAIPWAQKALELEPKMRQAATLLAIIYSITGDKEQAEKYRHIAIVNGQDPAALKSAIERYRTEQDTHEAEE